MRKPQKLHAGDTVATISPSWGCTGASRVKSCSKAIIDQAQWNIVKK